MHDVKQIFWDEPYLFHIFVDVIIRCCVPEIEMVSILEVCHLSPVGGTIVVSNCS